MVSATTAKDAAPKSEGPAASAAAGPSTHAVLRQQAEAARTWILNLPSLAKGPKWIHDSWKAVQPATRAWPTFKASGGWPDPRRVPDKSPLLAFLWWLSNCLDRPVLFAIVATIPCKFDPLVQWCAAKPLHRGPLYILALGLTALRTLLLWCAARPTRRIGLYTVLFVLWVVRAGAEG
jgi:hypothetical protein